MNDQCNDCKIRKLCYMEEPEEDWTCDHYEPCEYDEEDVTDINAGTKLGTDLAEVGTDCISRQAAIDICRAPHMRNADCSDFEMAIMMLPPAQPERIKGHWIESNGLNILMKKFIEKGETWRMCDKCGAGFMIGYQYECDKLYHETFHNFCPKCGAKMEVTE